VSFLILSPLAGLARDGPKGAPTLLPLEGENATLVISAGQTAVLHCQVKDLGEREVSEIYS